MIPPATSHTHRLVGAMPRTATRGDDIERIEHADDALAERITVHGGRGALARAR
jgi:hypothetical protein